MFWPFTKRPPARSVASDAPASRPPRVPLRPPAGLRFATLPGRLGNYVHLDNDHPFRRARTCEPLRVCEGGPRPREIGRGEVVGWMTAADPWADSGALPPETPGIYFISERGMLEWRPSGAFYRERSGILRLTR